MRQVQQNMPSGVAATAGGTVGRLTIAEQSPSLLQASLDRGILFNYNVLELAIYIH